MPTNKENITPPGQMKKEIKPPPIPPESKEIVPGDPVVIKGQTLYVREVRTTKTAKQYLLDYSKE